MSGALLKLTIIPFEDSEGGMGPPAGPPFIVQFNPETYTDTTEFKYGLLEVSTCVLANDGTRAFGSGKRDALHAGISNDIRNLIM